MHSRSDNGRAAPYQVDWQGVIGCVPVCVERVAGELGFRLVVFRTRSRYGGAGVQQHGGAVSHIALPGRTTRSQRSYGYVTQYQPPLFRRAQNVIFCPPTREHGYVKEPYDNSSEFCKPTVFYRLLPSTVIGRVSPP